MRVISYLSTFLMVAFLAACGGGGGSPGLSSGATPTTTAFFTTVPSAGLTLAKGVSNSFAIGGGTPPYLATSSNLAIASGSVNGTVLSIAGVGAGATSNCHRVGSSDTSNHVYDGPIECQYCQWNNRVLHHHRWQNPIHRHQRRPQRIACNCQWIKFVSQCRWWRKRQPDHQGC